MNSSQYKKQYLNNLKLEISNNNKNLSATSQFVQNTGQTILGVSTFKPEITKFNGFK